MYGSGIQKIVCKECYDVAESNDDEEIKPFDIGGLSLIASSVKVTRQASQLEVQDVPQLKTFQSKG
jgi:hypothetical protein